MTSLSRVFGPDGSSQAALVDDSSESYSTVSGDSLYWLIETPLAVRPLAYTVIAAAAKAQTPTAISLRGLAEDGTPATLSTRNLSLNARGSHYTSTTATSKSFCRFQLLVTKTADEDSQAASLMGFELYGTMLAAAGAEQMPAVQSVEASADGVSATEVIGKLNDQNRLTAYRAQFADSLAITFSYAAPVSIDTYTLTAGKDKENLDPTDWQLQGSADGEEWVTLDSRTGEKFSHRYATQFYRLGSQATYAHYRLVVRGVNGGTQLQLTEFQLLHLGLGTSVLPAGEILAAAGMQVSGGQLHVQAPQAGTLCVYDLQGRMLLAQSVQSGSTTLPLPQAQGVVVAVLRMQGGSLVRKVRL